MAEQRGDPQGEEDVDLVDLDLHCVPDREHCVRLDDPHLDAVHLDDPAHPDGSAP